MVEQAGTPNPEIEARITSAKAAIITALNNPHWQYARIAEVASNEEFSTALSLHGNGEWGYKFDMQGVNLGTLSNREAIAEFAKVKDPQAGAIATSPYNQVPSNETDIEKSEAELAKYVEENFDRLSSEFAGALEAAAMNLSALIAEQTTTPNPELQEQQIWEYFDQWYHSLSSEDRISGMRSGQWPEGTPQSFIEIANKTTVEERLLISIFGEKSTLSLEDIQARPADYVQRQDEESRQRQRQRLADARGVPVESIADQDLGSLSHEVLKQQVEDVLASLSERERQVLELRFGLEDGRSRTLDEVGHSIGRSESTVRRIEKTALAKLRHPSRSRRLRDYLEEEPTL